MKKSVTVEVEIDDAAVAVSVQEIVAHLTPEQQLSIARDVMLQWFAQPFDADRKNYEREVIERIKADKGNYNLASKADAEIRESWQFREKVRDFRSLREKIVDAASKAMTDALGKAAQEVVRTDPTVKRMVDAGVVAAVAAFPAMVQSAMIAQMARTAGEMGHGIYGALQEQCAKAWELTHEAIRKAAMGP